MTSLKFKWSISISTEKQPLFIPQAASQPPPWFIQETDVGDVQAGSIADVHEHHAQGNVDQGLVEERGMGIGYLSAHTGQSILSSEPR